MHPVQTASPRPIYHNEQVCVRTNREERTLLREQHYASASSEHAYRYAYPGEALANSRARLAKASSERDFARVKTR